MNELDNTAYNLYILQNHEDLEDKAYNAFNDSYYTCTIKYFYLHKSEYQVYYNEALKLLRKEKLKKLLK